VDLLPGDPELWRLMGYGRFKLGELDPAQTALRKSLELEPQPDTYDVLARVLHARGETPAAFDALTNSLALDPEHWPAHRARAELWRDIGEEESQLLSLSEAIELAPTVVDLRVTRGELYLARGQLAEAEADAVIAWDNDRHKATVRHLRALVYVARDQPRVALPQLRWLIEHRPTYERIDEVIELRDELEQGEPE
jgi:tetratricopeptide (TPR) repeat protein